MQLNFLQEDLLAIMQQSKPDNSSLLLRKPAGAKAAPAQPSLLPDLPVATRPAKDKQLKKTSKEAEEKSPQAFKTISEAADILGVPAYVLRFWEGQFAQIKPTKSRGGRRYYRPEDMEILSTIKTLLYLQGYTIKGARKALKEAGVEIFADITTAAPVSINPQTTAEKTGQKLTNANRAQLSRILKELLEMKKQLESYFLP